VKPLSASWRAGLVLAVALVAAAGFVIWYVYGAWPVPDGYEFPRHSMWGGGPTALFEGSLEDHDGCVTTDGGSTVVWPPGFSLSVVAERPVVHGGGRNIEMGQAIRLGGGEYSRAELHDIASGAAATRCPEPFFLTTGFAD
jgi:hypothetical protein